MTATYNYIIDTGSVAVDTTDLLTDVQSEWKGALGQSLNTAASTPQGTLITTEVLARTSVMKNNAEMANMMNPQLAYQTFLDAVCAFLDVDRGSDSSTIGTGIPITGDSQTTIQAGSRVQTSAGDIFTTINTVTIGVGGTATVDIQSVEYGAIPLAAGALTIIDGTIGWGTATVSGGTSVVLGANSLTDPQLKNTRNVQLASMGLGSSAAIIAAVSKVPNVTSVAVIENNTGATGVVNGITFTLPSALWVCVAGSPLQADVAAALYDAHQGGCPWDFGTSCGTPVAPSAGVSTIDPATGVSYFTKWTQPILYDCYVNITVSQGTSSAAANEAVPSAMVTYATGNEPGEAGLVIGADVSAFEMAGAVTRQLPGMYVKACSVAIVTKGSPPPAYPGAYSLEVILTPFQQAVLSIGNVTVSVV